MSWSIFYTTFYLLFICDIVLSKKLLHKFNAQKLNECNRCKILSDSFNFWIEKTSRGKYEGGDVAWEEAKLKTYARSEIRLVEVQEGLCSELKSHQDDCYVLAEEAEQVLEKWWFDDGPKSADLYSWLCIDTLQYCCPKNHYGESCLPCPNGKNNEVCSGHGSCNESRKGDGKCKCKKGYDGTSCDVCAKNFYLNKDICQPCHKACNGCSGDGANMCNECKLGWSLELGECVDIDECVDTTICKPDEYCSNNEGSYVCYPCDKSCKTCLGGGVSNCTSCVSDHVLWSGFCMDDKLKSDLFRNTLKKLALYCGLLVIAFFIFRNTKTLASVVILIISIFIFISEKSSDINTVDVISNLYLK
ncbi:cysteine-rich with EGF-like domain protein 2 [Amyelois transitella]|uniref:cysteine-rich with EGF-like domain protein 2 n=1 Tax=Amyelois transitella TaxID=680683 RepID=UPI00067CFF6C|nr:cysteine-rich with EGF-like domain protein 2 [Amyelois transitella]